MVRGSAACVGSTVQTREPILLQPLGHVDGEILQCIRRKLAAVLGLAGVVGRALDEPARAFDPSRGQYQSDIVLEMLGEVIAPGFFKVLGVTHVDLCTPILTYVFGRGQLGGKCAVISLARLRPEFYGESEDGIVFLSRVEKEAVHELGHTLGLVHCADVNCVMHASNVVMDTDVKGDAFCPPCRAELFRNLRRLC